MARLTAGVAAWLSVSTRMIVHGSGGEEKLNAGTSFLVYGIGEPHHWKFSLNWKADRSEIQAMSWDTPRLKMLSDRVRMYLAVACPDDRNHYAQQVIGF